MDSVIGSTVKTISQNVNSGVLNPIDSSATSENIHSKEHRNNKSPLIWSVASGKGGVGKTFLTSSLAITLSKLGHNVIVIDLDSNGANIHTAFGSMPSKVGLYDYFQKIRPLKDCLSSTSLLNVSFVQGFWDNWSPVELSRDDMKTLVTDAKSLACDYVLIDLGSGPLDRQLEVFKNSDEKIIVTTPEPTSIERTYRFIESFLCDLLRENSIPPVYEKLIEGLRNYRHFGLAKNFSFKDFLTENEGLNKKSFEDLQLKPMRLLLNCCRSQTNSTLGFSMRSVCNKYYDLSLDYLGGLDYDNAVWQSIRNREAVLIAQPFTPLAGQLLSICKQLIDPEQLRAVI